MIAIIIFFITHWVTSLFFHTFFLHRYASHQMYTTGKRRERLFYFLTWFSQGSSFLMPYSYAILHRMHHIYSDSDKDPHSPHFFKDIFRMMWNTRVIYDGFVTGKKIPDPQLTKEYLPSWRKLDAIGNSFYTRLVFVFAYVLFYIHFAPSAWYFLLLPIHILMGPIQGAIVNWCGHKYGYSNYNNGDHSKNTEPLGIFLMGELFQNNHHKFPNNANFAKKWFEIDPAYQIMRLMSAIRIIKLKKQMHKAI
jgi:stearoyl-CoA desaturase (delta-9 desaturase)